MLLKGEVGIEFDPNLEAGYQARVKIGDGVSTWAELKYFGEAEAQRFAKVYQVEVANGADKVAAIEAVVAGAEKKSGDIAIVKELIAEALLKDNILLLYLTEQIGQQWTATTMPKMFIFQRT